MSKLSGLACWLSNTFFDVMCLNRIYTCEDWIRKKVNSRWRYTQKTPVWIHWYQLILGLKTTASTCLFVQNYSRDLFFEDRNQNTDIIVPGISLFQMTIKEVKIYQWRHIQISTKWKYLIYFLLIEQYQLRT